MHRRNKSQRGNSILESALVLSTFLFMMIGVLDFGQFLYIHKALVERARNAIRWGTVQTYNHDQIQNMVLYNQPTTPTDGSTAIFGLTTSSVDVSMDTTVTPSQIQIFIHNYPYQMFSPLIAGMHYGPNILATSPTETVN